MPTETYRVPLIGVRLTGRLQKRGLKIRASDCPGPFPPPHVNAQHREIQRAIDRRRVRDGVEHGWIAFTNDEVTDYEVDAELMA